MVWLSLFLKFLLWVLGWSRLCGFGHHLERKDSSLRLTIDWVMTSDFLNLVKLVEIHISFYYVCLEIYKWGDGFNYFTWLILMNKMGVNKKKKCVDSCSLWISFLWTLISWLMKCFDDIVVDLNCLSFYLFHMV